MAMPIIRQLRTRLQRTLAEASRHYYNHFWGMHIGKGCRISLKARLDKTNPGGLTIGDYTIVTFDVAILTHDFVNRRHLPVKIGSHCFIGCGSIIMPGVTIGDHCIIGAGTLVREDVPAHSIVAGNPGKIIASDIETLEWGIRPQPGEITVLKRPEIRQGN